MHYLFKNSLCEFIYFNRKISLSVLLKGRNVSIIYVYNARFIKNNVTMKVEW